MSLLTTAFPDTDGRIRQSHRRLAITLVLSTIAIAVALTLLTIDLTGPAQDDPPKPLEVVLQEPETLPILQPDTRENLTSEELPEKPADEPTQSAEEKQTEDSSTKGSEAKTIETNAPRIDWYAELETTASMSNEFEEKTPSMSPEFDELRRIAAIRYSKPDTRSKKPIWENVEKDMLGRTILRYGDCYRVLEDPSVMNRWAQETFAQYLVFCGKPSEAPKMLPWVDEINARYNKTDAPVGAASSRD